MPFARTAITNMSGYVPGEQPRDRRYIKLNTNENPYPPTPQVQDVLSQVDSSRLRLYPDPTAEKLRQKIAALFDIQEQQVICGNGSDDLLTMGVRTFVDQGGCLAYPTPTYSLYPVLAAIQGARCAEIPLSQDFRFPVPALKNIADASLLFIPRPNAPTGTAYAPAVMREICRQFKGIVWIDEAYADFADENCASFVKEFPNVVVSRTLSKSYSLAAVRFGFAMANADLVAQMLKVKDSYNVNMLTQDIALAALTDRAYMQKNVERVKTTRVRSSQMLQQHNWQVIDSQANFLFAKPPIAAECMLKELRRAGILVRYFPGERTKDFLRITIGTDAEMDVFLAAVADIQRHLAKGL